LVLHVTDSHPIVMALGAHIGIVRRHTAIRVIVGWIAIQGAPSSFIGARPDTEGYDKARRDFQESR
jgi:hypothetical protein